MGEVRTQGRKRCPSRDVWWMREGTRQQQRQQQQQQQQQQQHLLAKAQAGVLEGDLTRCRRSPARDRGTATAVAVAAVAPAAAAKAEASPASGAQSRCRAVFLRKLRKRRLSSPSGSSTAFVVAASLIVAAVLSVQRTPCFAAAAGAWPREGEQHSNDEAASSESLWDVVSTDPSYSELTACLERSSPYLIAALKNSSSAPLTLFAPSNEAFERVRGGAGRQQLWTSTNRTWKSFDTRCHGSYMTTISMQYHISTTTSPVPYIGEEFETLYSGMPATYYGIYKSADVPSSSFPIQFINDANITAPPVPVGPSSYIFPVDRVLETPKSTVWKLLESDSSFSLVVKALGGTDLARALDNRDSPTRYTLFAPDNDAIEASSGLPEDPAAVEVLMSFHTLATGTYPLSQTGAHFSQQLFKVDPTGGTLARDYYRQFYADSFVGAQVKSMAGPLLNVSRLDPSDAGAWPLPKPPLPQDYLYDPFLAEPLEETASRAAQARMEALSMVGALVIEGVPVSEANIPARNGVVHRLSERYMAPPPTVAGVLLDPPFPLSAAGAAAAGSGGFEALGELVRLAWPLVNETLSEDGPLTVLAPTDTAFELAVAAGQLPPRPWNMASLEPEQAARVVLSHTLVTPDGPLLFSPTAAEPFASDFKNGDRFSTAAYGRSSSSSVSPSPLTRDKTPAEVGVRVVEVGTRSSTIGSADVPDNEVYIDNARVTQCVDGAGIGHDCGTSPRPSNTYALNGAHLCAVHAVDRVLFPADADTDLVAMLDADPNLSRFSNLLREQGLMPVASMTPSGGDSRLHSTGTGTGTSARSGSDNIAKEDSAGAAYTIFAPTNGALERLESERPWLFQSSSARRSAPAVGADTREDDGKSEGGEVEAFSPIRELLAYHLVPGDGIFSRYLNASFRQTTTLALDGTAPLAASFASPNDTGRVGPRHSSSLSADGSLVHAHLVSDGDEDGVAARRGFASTVEAATLRINLQVCSSVDSSASNGVLHVLSFGDDGGRDDGRDGRSSGDGAGVLVPDVLELAYAHGFHDMYAAIVAAGAEREQGPPALLFSSEDVTGPLSQNASARETVAQALRGPSAHTLLAVGDSVLGEVGSSSGLSGDTLRYQTLLGDQTLRFDGSPSMALETLFSTHEGVRTRTHAFDNSETPGNPFVPSNGSSLYIDHAQLLSPEEGVVALNGRLFEISDALRAPAPSVFSLLSSTPELSGWAEWVQLTGLAELLADESAGPFTVFAPVDASLELVPGRLAIGADADGLFDLVQFHVAVGTTMAGHDGIDSRLARRRLFTPTLANATADERSVLIGERFASASPLRTLLDAEASSLHMVVQIGAAASSAAASGGSAMKRSEGRSGSDSGVHVFLGPGSTRREHEAGGLRKLVLGAFAAEVVLPDLNAVNGVVHGISAVLTPPGYKRAPVPLDTA